MPTFTQIVGALIVVGALIMGAHEVWLHRRRGGERSRRRLRRRLTGVALILLLIALLTWAGALAGGDRGQALLRLGLYGASLLIAVVLLGLAYADSRETTREVLRDVLSTGDPELDEYLSVQAQEIVTRLSDRDLPSEERERLSHHLESILQRRPPEGPE